MGWRSWAIGSLGIVAACTAADRHETPARDVVVSAVGQATTTAPPLVVVSTDRSGHSRAFRVTPATTWPAPFATVLHRADATPRTVLHPDGPTLLAASRGHASDRSFDYVLFRLDTAGVTELASGLTHAGRPLVHDAGQVLVIRGEAGTPVAGEARIDRFTLDAVNIRTGTVVPWHHFEGHHLHLAAIYDGEAFLYRVGPEHADLVAVNPQGQLRTVRTALLPFARDFSVDDAGRMVFRQRHPQKHTSWRALRIDTQQRDAAPEVLFEDESFALAPHAWPGGGVLLNARREGMQLLGSADPVPDHPLGPGVDLVRATSRDGRFVALLHTRAGALPSAFVVDRTTGAVMTLEVPAGERVAIAGFQEGSP